VSSKQQLVSCPYADTSVGNVQIAIGGRFFPVIGIGDKGVKMSVEFDLLKMTYKWE